jgi:ABC-type uncharacterized transport system permease subunit
MNQRWAGPLATAACIAAGVLVLILVIRIAGANPLNVAQAVARGAAGGSWNVGNTLVQTIPLLLTGLGVAVAFKGRLFNIGAEGQLLLGAIAATAVGTAALPPAIHLPASIAAGAVAGAAWAGIAAWLKLRRGVQEVLSTLLLNFVAAQLLAWMVRGPLQERAAQFPQSDPVAIPSRFTVIWPGTTLHAGGLLALLLVVGIAVFLRKSAAGFALRAVGANSEAARAAGLPVDRTVAGTLLLSGALCGIAGAVQVCGVTYFLADPYSKGYGYTAIAVALLAGLSPGWLLPSALFFGALAASASEIQTAGLSSVFVQVFQAVVLLSLLAAGWARERAAVAVSQRESQ